MNASETASNVAFRAKVIVLLAVMTLAGVERSTQNAYAQSDISVLRGETRYISLPDIEAQLAPNNYTYSHSILYTFDAYTQTGINVSTRLNDHWLVQVGLSAGNDVAPWIGEPDAKPTFNSCVILQWQGGPRQPLCVSEFAEFWQVRVP